MLLGDALILMLSFLRARALPAPRDKLKHKDISISLILILSSLKLISRVLITFCKCNAAELCWGITTVAAVSSLQCWVRQAHFCPGVTEKWICGMPALCLNVWRCDDYRSRLKLHWFCLILIAITSDPGPVFKSLCLNIIFEAKSFWLNCFNLIFFPLKNLFEPQKYIWDGVCPLSHLFPCWAFSLKSLS